MTSHSDTSFLGPRLQVYVHGFIKLVVLHIQVMILYTGQCTQL